ncbi:MAG: peptidylprolyl isomerase [Alphaproteobacteria bacterium]
MKKMSRFAFVLGASLISHGFNAHAADPVAAKVNDKTIKVSEVLDEMKGLNLGKDAPQEKIFEMIRDRLVELNLLVGSAKTAGLENDPDITKALEKFKERLLIQSFVAKEVKSKVTEQAIQEALKDFPSQKEVKLRHIVVADEKTALSVKKALANGSDFTKLAASVSTDEASKHKGGELGTILESQLPEPLAKAVKDVKAGAYASSPVVTQLGHHIIKVDERKDASQAAILPLVREKLEQQTLLKIVEEAKKSAKIDLFDQEGKPAKEASKPAEAKPAA